VVTDKSEGQAFRVVAVFTDEVFARSEEEAVELHKRLLKDWAKTGELDRAPMRDVESSQVSEEQCYISYRKQNNG